MDDNSPANQPEPSAPQGLSARRRWLFRAIFLLLLALPLLVFGELFAEIMDDEARVQRRLKESGLYAPHEAGAVAELVGEEFRVPIHINAFGYRDRLDRQLTRDALRPRVLVLGDSFTFGWGVGDDETYSALLEAKSGVEVINAGQCGGNALYFIPQARAALPKWQPDQVIIQVFDNDPFDAWTDRDRFGLSEDGLFLNIPSELAADHGDDLSARFSRLALRRSWRRFIRRLRGEPLYRPNFVKPGRQLDRQPKPEEQVRREQAAQIWAPPNWVGEFAFHDPKRRADFAPQLALHRSLFNQLLRELEAAKRPVTVLYIPCYQSLIDEQSLDQRQARNPLWLQLEELCRAQKDTGMSVELVDGAALFLANGDPQENYFLFDGHLNARGHARIAEALGPRITALKKP